MDVMKELIAVTIANSEALLDMKSSKAGIAWESLAQTSSVFAALRDKQSELEEVSAIISGSACLRDLAESRSGENWQAALDMVIQDQGERPDQLKMAECICAVVKELPAKTAGGA